MRPGAPRALQMPAAGLAAQSGAPILFVTPERIPAATGTVLRELRHPSMYVVAPQEIRARTLVAAAPLRVASRRSARATPKAPAPSPTRSRWRASPTAASAGASKNRGTGSSSPTSRGRSTRPPRRCCRRRATTRRCCCSNAPGEVPTALADYLGNIQPAYTAAPQFRPVRGVYNHGWLIGDESAISARHAGRNRLSAGDQPAQAVSRRSVRHAGRISEGRELEPGRGPPPRAAQARPQEVTLEDVRQLMGASTPHFALQLRNRIANLIAGLRPIIPRAWKANARSRACSGSASAARRAARAQPRASARSPR